MADDLDHEDLFNTAEERFHNAEYTVAHSLHDKAGGRDCTTIWQSLHYMATQVGEMKEHLEGWQASDLDKDDPHLIAGARGAVKLAEQTLASLRDRFRTRCVKVN